MNVVGLMVFMFCLASNMGMNDLSPHGEIYIREYLGLCVYILVRTQSNCPQSILTRRQLIIILCNIRCSRFLFLLFHYSSKLYWQAERIEKQKKSR